MSDKMPGLEESEYVARTPRVRPELEQLSQLAQRVLESHTRRKGESWKKVDWCPPYPDSHLVRQYSHTAPGEPRKFGVSDLLDLLDKQVREVRSDVATLASSGADGFVLSVNTAKLATEIGDVVNFCMMIADVTGCLAWGGVPSSSRLTVPEPRSDIPTDLRSLLRTLARWELSEKATLSTALDLRKILQEADRRGEL